MISLAEVSGSLSPYRSAFLGDSVWGRKARAGGVGMEVWPNGDLERAGGIAGLHCDGASDLGIYGTIYHNSWIEILDV